MKKIKLKVRTFVKGIGVCESGSTTTCGKEVADYLIKVKLATEVK